MASTSTSTKIAPSRIATAYVRTSSPATQARAGAQVEAPAVPDAGQRRALDGALLEPVALVRAGAVDRVDAVVGAHEHDLARAERDGAPRPGRAELGDGARVAHRGPMLHAVEGRGALLLVEPGHDVQRERPEVVAVDEQLERAVPRALEADAVHLQDDRRRAHGHARERASRRW